jgi:hypothetical protein
MSRIRKLILATLAVVGLLIVGLAAIVMTGNTMTVLAMLAGPPRDWDEKRLAPPPDYASPAAWAAWPDRTGLADYRPEGVAAPAVSPQVDVFFIHPTGYMNGADWNAPLDPNSRTEENTQWMMANQASAYNGSARVFAPRYRQASFFRYISASEDVGQKTMDLAYSDVLRAFEYFLAHANNGRPFIIASHSQGSQHAFRLLQERIDATPLEKSLVAAYVIGTRITNADAGSLKSIKVCDKADQTGCLVHWAAMGDGGSPPPGMTDLVCVNPLSWTRDGGRVEAAAHKGGVPISGAFSAQMFGSDAAQGMQFPPLGAPLPAMTWAECRGGFLYVKDLAETVFAPVILPGKNYHGLDYPLFHMDIRQNVELRLQAWLAGRSAPTTSPATQE